MGQIDKFKKLSDFSKTEFSNLYALNSPKQSKMLLKSIKYPLSVSLF